jgi:hypothetical protein
LAVAAAIAATVIGCHGPGDIRFDHDGCSIDGHRASLSQVEEREAAVGHRIASRQPWLVAITILVVSLAGVSYVERLLLLFSARKGVLGMGDRMKALVDRHRAHPVRYFLLVSGTVGLLLFAGALYIYFDADKRSSERALGTLQFCHLALRTSDEKRALDEQRRNLTAIRDTAGEIRQLIDKLPPAEQAKAHEIVGHMDDAVKHEGRLLTDHLQRSEEMAESIRDGTQSIARGLTGLEDRMSSLNTVPGAVLAVGDAVHRLETRATTGDEALTQVRDKLTTMQKAVDALTSRPAPTCPACVCGGERTSFKQPHVDGSAN